jgi:APA family basic amino acid/polyamine antiporter
VIFLRIKHPEMERPFRVPGGIFTAVLGIIACLALAGFNFLPMIENAMSGNPLPLTILAVYAAVGAVVYAAYGFWNSKLAKGIDITEETTMSSPAAALGGDVDNVKED